MSTTGEGDAVFYQGGGAGGKYPKRPARRTKQMTPYDRPISSLRATATAARNDHSGGWLTKLVVDPASKLISYGANRFFSSLFRKRLPAPPRQLPEANHELSSGFQGSGHENHSGGDEPARDNGSHLISSSAVGGDEPARDNGCHLISSSAGGGISELEQLLKQKSFTRSEIERLTELLHSKAVQFPGSDEKMTGTLLKPQTDFESQQHYSSVLLGKDKILEDKSHRVVSTPSPGSKVLEHEIASPAELAKAYMGSRPSKLSPSMLGTRNQPVTEGLGSLSNVLFTPKPPITSFTMKNAVNREVHQYGSVTPRSRGRSAIYNMARSPYSRVYPTDIHKGTGSTNGYGGPSSLSPLEVDHYRQLGPNKSTLKRRSSMLDDDLGSVGPIRRIRQKSSLLSQRSPLSTHGVEIASDVAQISTKQKDPLANEPRHKVSKIVGENEKDSAPSTSYTHVPSKSSEVAARILQHLEKLTPKEKSLGEKPAYGQEKLRSKMKPIRLQDGQKLEGWPIASLPGAHDSTSQKPSEVEENGPKVSVDPPEMPTATMHTKVSVNTSRPIFEAADSAVKNFASQPPQKRQAFEMRVHEDYLEQDDNEHSNGPEPQPLGDRTGPAMITLSDGKPSPAEGKLGNTSIQLELKSSPGPLSSKCSDIESSGVVVGKESTVFTSTASQEPSTSSQSTLLPQSVSNIDKPKEVNTSPSFFNFGAKVDDRSPSFVVSSSTPEPSNKKLFPWAESKPESSSSSGNVLPTATGSQQIIAETKKDTDQNTQNASGTVAKSGNAPSFSSNGSLVSSPPAFSFTASTTVAKMASSSPAASSGSLFGSNVAAPSSTIKFGVSADPSSTVSGSTSNVSDSTSLQSKAENKTIFGDKSNTSSTISSFMTSSASNTFGLGSTLASSSANGQSQSSSLGAASGFSVGTVSQSTPVQFGTSASLPAFGSSSVTVSSQASSSPISFGFSSSLASSSATNGIISGNEPTSTPSKFVGNNTSGVNAVSSAIVTTGLPSFGASSSSSGVNPFGASTGASFGIFSSASALSETAGNTSGANAVSSGSVATGLSSFAASSSSSGTSSPSFGIFSFGASASASTPGTTNASSNNSTSTPGLFTFGGNSSASSVFTTTSSFSGFSFGASSSPATNTNSTVLNSSSGSASSTSAFSFSAASSPVFGNPSTPFGNNNQTSPEDGMAVDTVQSSTPSLPVFGQPSISPSPPAVMFGSASTPQANPFQSTPQANPFQSTPQANPFQSTPQANNLFQFGGQPNQVAQENPSPSPFQASTSLGGFSASGGFSLGSGGGGDKSGRKIVKVNRNRNRKK